MADERQVLREVAWRDLFPSGLILSTWRAAIHMRALGLATCGLLATFAGLYLLEAMFRVDPQSAIHPALAAAEELGRVGSIESAMGNPGEWWGESPMLQPWLELARPFVRLMSERVSFAGGTDLLLAGFWTLGVWAFFGGALTRLAALRLARDEQASWGELLGYARDKWPAYFAAPLMPLLGILLSAIPLAILGWLAWLGSVGSLLAGLLWPVALVAGVVMAVLALGLFLGGLLMWPTISTEGTDTFDALSRSYAYSLQRPLHYLSYCLGCFILGTIGWRIVLLFAATVRGLTFWAISLGSGEQRLLQMVDPSAAGQGIEFVGGTLACFWNLMLLIVASSFVYSFFWSAATAIYLLLRFQVDATEVDEVYLSDEATALGLPELKPDAAGVPQAVDSSATSPEG